MTDPHSRRAESRSRPSHASDREKQTTLILHTKMEDCNNCVKTQQILFRKPAISRYFFRPREITRIGPFDPAGLSSLRSRSSRTALTATRFRVPLGGATSARYTLGFTLACQRKTDAIQPKAVKGYPIVTFQQEFLILWRLNALGGRFNRQSKHNQLFGR